MNTNRNNNKIHPHHKDSADPHRQITFLSPDGQIEIAVVSEGGLKRWPPHDGKVAVMRVQARPHTRVRRLNDGRTEIVFRHAEVMGLLYALNACEQRGFVYEMPRKTTHKSERCRRYWEAKNAERVHRQRCYY